MCQTFVCVCNNDNHSGGCYTKCTLPTAHSSVFIVCSWFSVGCLFFSIEWLCYCQSAFPSEIIADRVFFYLPSNLFLFHLFVVRKLLSQGVCPNVTNTDGLTALHQVSRPRLLHGSHAAPKRSRHRRVRLCRAPSTLRAWNRLRLTRTIPLSQVLIVVAVLRVLRS